MAGGPYAIVVTDAAGGAFSASNYVVTYVNGALAVTAAPLTVTANSASKTYGQTASFAPGAFTSSGLQNSDAIDSVTQTSTGAVATASVAGGPYAIVATDAAGGAFSASNYLTTYVDGALTVARAPLTVTSHDVSKLYGETLTLNGTAFSSSGLQNGETSVCIQQVWARRIGQFRRHAISSTNPHGASYDRPIRHDLCGRPTTVESS